jgi:hypothetical protein
LLPTLRAFCRKMAPLTGAVSAAGGGIEDFTSNELVAGTPCARPPTRLSTDM